MPPRPPASPRVSAGIGQAGELLLFRVAVLQFAPQNLLITRSVDAELHFLNADLDDPNADIWPDKDVFIHSP